MNDSQKKWSERRNAQLREHSRSNAAADEARIARVIELCRKGNADALVAQRMGMRCSAVQRIRAAAGLLPGKYTGE